MKASKNTIYTGLFNDSFYPVRDGVAVAVENYAQWLPKYGMSPLVVTPWNKPMPDVDYTLLRFLSIPIIGRKPYRLGLRFLDPFINYKVRNTKFDLVHAHSPFSSGKLARYAAKKQGIPLIATFHSKFRSDFERSLHGHRRVVDRVIKNVIDFFESCDEVWIPQQEVEETIREYGYKGEVSVVPNGNDLASIVKGDLAEHKQKARKSCNIDSDKIALLFVGQHIFEKGLPLIVDTLCKLRDANVPFRMNFIGNGYAQGWLKQQISDRGLTEFVNILGPIRERKRLADYYAASDILFFPSPYDNAPLVVREAAAMGTASMLLAGSTAAQIAKDNIDAFLCPDDAAGCAEIVSALYADRKRIIDAGLMASKSLSRSWEDIVSEVADRYRVAIRNKAK